MFLQRGNNIKFEYFGYTIYGVNRFLKWGKITDFYQHRFLTNIMTWIRTSIQNFILDLITCLIPHVSGLFRICMGNYINYLHVLTYPVLMPVQLIVKNRGIRIQEQKSQENDPKASLCTQQQFIMANSCHSPQTMACHIERLRLRMLQECITYEIVDLKIFLEFIIDLISLYFRAFPYYTGSNIGRSCKRLLI